MMKNKISMILTGCLLIIVGLGCEFTTANLSEITFSDSEKGGTTFTSAKQNEKIYALSSTNNTSGKHIVRWKITDSGGEEIQLPENEMKVEGARSVWLTMTLKPQLFPEGKYTFKVTLLNESGDKEIDTKTATLDVTN